MSLSTSLRNWARQLKRDSVSLWFAYRHPDTPLLTRGLCVLVVAYALSPIDLIPDFVPILGYADDLLLLPGLIWLALRLLPTHVLDASRIEADRWMTGQRRKPRSYAGAVMIVALWIGALALGWSWLAGLL